MKDFSCAFGCVEMFFCLCVCVSKTWAGHSIYKKCIFPFRIIEWYICFVLWCLPSGGWGCTKGMYACFEVSILSACRSVSESMGDEKRWEKLHWHNICTWTFLTCLDPLLKVVLQMVVYKNTHAFVLLYNCKIKSRFCFCHIWELKGKENQLYFKASANAN